MERGGDGEREGEGMEREGEDREREREDLLGTEMERSRGEGGERATERGKVDPGGETD